MAITAEQNEKFKAWIRSKGLDVRCSVCGNNLWNVGDIIAPPLMDPHHGIHQDLTTPMLVMACKNCGSIRLFSARQIGLI